MQLTRQCYTCKQSIRKDEMISYAGLNANTPHWYCKKCYEAKLERERFSMKVCEIFGIKSPGPVIWTQRKKLQETYGYTDNTIIDCLEYVYNVKKVNKLSESLYFVKPAMMEEMKKWKATKRGEAGSLAAAMANTTIVEHDAPIREYRPKKKEINLDDALLD